MAFSFTPQQQPQQQNLFQSPFNQKNSFFQQPQQQQNPLFQLQPQQQQQQQPQFQQQQQQQQQLYLYTNDKAPASYGTKWADLHLDSQKVLLQIEEKLLEYRGESQRLDQCSRLYDSSVSIDGFEPDATHIIQELGGVGKNMERQKAVLQELMTVVKDMLRNTEIAIRSFMMLRPRFIHPKSNAAPSANTLTVATAANTQSTTSSMVPVYDFYNGFPKKPSPFLQHTVARFEKELNECRQWVEELEQLLLVDSERHSSNSSSSLLQSLPKVMSNVHDFFVHVAAKVESIHQYIESMKAAYLVDQRRRGEGNNPFLEADRRETAKQEAAAKRIHPTLHLPAVQQPTTQVASLFATSATPVASTTPPTALPAASSGSSFSIFGTPSIATSSSSLFSTPTIAASSSSIFSTPVASAPASSLFGGSPQTPAIGASTPAFGTGASLFGSTASASFSTPFATGAAGGSGASFNASFNTASKSRAKSRPGRR